MTGSAHLFAELVALGREEHGLVVDGRYDDLPALHERRSRLMAALPASAPPEALADVREAARLSGLVTEALREARDATGAELARLGQARAGARGYAAGTGLPAGPHAHAAFDRAG
ncbi:hypothetical protein FSW04_04010 [Baekduia soli]|uniref:Flagellar protein FlgN n=1 Tax=Baekduia soli TaxID=496014 RepID=A0A5B8U1M3_9ACTN|nr:hypothetical protein [Baekduia soli]QEC46832.1 hypothetical protein FSW04_04010 [Baekduia soli]